jgi:hypothetical protein
LVSDQENELIRIRMRAGEWSELAPILFRSLNKAIRQRVGKAEIIAVVFK